MGNYQNKIDNLVKYSCSTFANDNAEDVQNNARKAIEAFCKIIIVSHYGEDRGNKIIFSQDEEWNKKLKVTSKQKKKQCEFVLNMLLKVIVETYYPDNKITKSKKIDIERNIKLLIFKGNSSSHESSPIKMDNDDTIITQKILSKLLRWLFLDFLEIEIPDKLIMYIGQYDIFLSYRHTDMEWIKILEFNLKSQGYTIFRDESHMIAGEKTQQLLYNAINKSKCGIVIYPDKDNSDWIVNEMEWMKERQRRDSNFRIIPIVMHSSKYIIDKNMLYIDFLTKEYKTAFNELICAIKGVPPLKNYIKGEIKIPKKEVSLEQPIGSLPIDSKFYIKRYSDKQAFLNLKSRYTLIRIKAPTQYGKTSLLMRLISKAKDEQYHVVYFNFQEFDKYLLSNIEELLNFICDMIAFELDVDITLNSRITKLLTPKTRATKKMEKILSSISVPLVLAIDEADRLFEYRDISDEFFTLIRAWHEYSKSNSLWEKLKIILSHSTEALLGISNINRSPFNNVGLGVEIQPFNIQETKLLAKKYNVLLGEKELKIMQEFFGGHPYLTQQTLYTMATENKSIFNIIDSAYSRDSIFKKHMQRYLFLIKENPNLIEILRDILQEKRVVDDRRCYILESTGLIRESTNYFGFSCKLYYDFFVQRL